MAIQTKLIKCDVFYKSVDSNRITHAQRDVATRDNAPNGYD